VRWFPVQLRGASAGRASDSERLEPRIGDIAQGTAPKAFAAIAAWNSFVERACATTAPTQNIARQTIPISV